MSIINEFCKRWREMTAWRRTRKCSHEFDYRKEMTHRDASGKVSCRCRKCGVVFFAECGLDLPGKLVQLKDNHE